jgi:hypothetical protein
VKSAVIPGPEIVEQVGLAEGGHDSIAMGECGLGETAAESTAGAGDEPYA